jgi:hypothetical protein
MIDHREVGKRSPESGAQIKLIEKQSDEAKLRDIATTVW